MKRRTRTYLIPRPKFLDSVLEVYTASLPRNHINRVGFDELEYEQQEALLPLGLTKGLFGRTAGMSIWRDCGREVVCEVGECFRSGLHFRRLFRGDMEGKAEKSREVVAVIWRWADELFDFAFRCSASTTTNTNNAWCELWV